MKYLAISINKYVINEGKERKKKGREEGRETEREGGGYKLKKKKEVELFPTTNKKKSFHIKVKLGQRQNKAIYPELFTVTAEEEKREFKLINVNKRNPMFVKALRRD